MAAYSLAAESASDLDVPVQSGGPSTLREGLGRASRRQRREEIMARAAVGIAAGASCNDVVPPALAGMAETIDSVSIALVLPGAKVVVGRASHVARPDVEAVMLDEALE